MYLVAPWSPVPQYPKHDRSVGGWFGRGEAHSDDRGDAADERCNDEVWLAKHIPTPQRMKMSAGRIAIDPEPGKPGDLTFDHWSKVQMATRPREVV